MHLNSLKFVGKLNEFYSLIAGVFIIILLIKLPLNIKT